MILAVLDHGLKPNLAHSAGIPFAMQRAAREPGSASAVTAEQGVAPGPATPGTPLSPGMSGCGVGRCPLGLPGWVKPHEPHPCLSLGL